MGQHLIQIVQHAFEKFALRTRLNDGNQNVTERPAVLEEKHGEDGDDEDHPCLLRDVGNTQSRRAVPVL